MKRQRLILQTATLLVPLAGRLFVGSSAPLSAEETQRCSTAVRDYLQAWVARDYPSMYRLLAADVRRSLSPEDLAGALTSSREWQLVDFRDLAIVGVGKVGALVIAKLVFPSAPGDGAGTEREYEFLVVPQEGDWRIARSASRQAWLAPLSDRIALAVVHAAERYWQAWCSRDAVALYAALSPAYRRRVSLADFADSARLAGLEDRQVRLYRLCAPDIPLTQRGEPFAHANVRVQIGPGLNADELQIPGLAWQGYETYLTVGENAEWWVVEPHFGRLPPWVKDFRLGAKKLGAHATPALDPSTGLATLRSYLEAWRDGRWDNMYQLLSSSARETWSCSPTAAQQLFASRVRELANANVRPSGFVRLSVVEQGPDYLRARASITFEEDSPEDGIRSGAWWFSLCAEDDQWRIATEFGSRP